MKNFIVVLFFLSSVFAKPLQESCVVIGHRKAIGKNILAAFMCKRKNGDIIKIENGLNNYQRKHFIPKIGKNIVFQYEFQENRVKFPIFLYKQR